MPSSAPSDLAEFCLVEYPRLVGALSLYCGDREVAQDLAQDALVRACERWGSVRQMSAPGAWVYRVALNLAHSHYRRAGTLDRILRRQPSRNSDALDAADVIAVRLVVAGLPRRQREAVIVRYYLGLTVEESAEVLRTTPSSVRNLTHRAIRTMRDALGDPVLGETAEAPNGT